MIACGSYSIGHDSIVRVAHARVCPVILVSIVVHGVQVGKKEVKTNKLMRTSPGPGSGTSISTTLVDTVPG